MTALTVKELYSPDQYARDMIAEELAHQDEVDKMLRKPGQTEPFAA